MVLYAKENTCMQVKEKHLWAEAVSSLLEPHPRYLPEEVEICSNR